MQFFIQFLNFPSFSWAFLFIFLWVKITGFNETSTKLTELQNLPVMKIFQRLFFLWKKNEKFVFELRNINKRRWWKNGSVLSDFQYRCSLFFSFQLQLCFQFSEYIKVCKQNNRKSKTSRTLINLISQLYSPLPPKFHTSFSDFVHVDYPLTLSG